MREDYFTNTPEDAGRYEEMRAETDAAADRPTLAEVDGDDGMSWPKAFDAWDAHEMDEARERLALRPGGISMTLQYKVSRDLGIVTVYPANLPSGVNREAFAVDMDESDLILMLHDLRTGTRAELAGS